MSTIRLGDLLIRAGVVNDAQLSAALAEQKQWGGRLGSVLVRMGFLSEDLLVKALARQLNLPRAPISPGDPPINVPAAIMQRLDQATCERLMMLPVAYVQERRSIQVAVVDPSNVVAVDDLSRRLGARIEIMIAGETALAHAIARAFGGSPMLDRSIRGDEAGMAFMDNSGRAMSQAPQTSSSSSSSSSSSMPPVAQSSVPQAAQPGWGASPSGSWPASQAPAPAAVSQAPSPAWTQPPAPAAPADDLRVLADQQLRAVRALVELLIERGVISRAELQAWLGR